jgi:hypothetical protein
MQEAIMKKSFWFSLCSLFFSVSAASSQQAPKVESFSPQGTVKNVRQVKARFTHPMVAFVGMGTFAK